MTTRELFLLSPYRPPTSYPVTLNADEAAAWLNAHAALWHPAALRGASRPPQAASAYDHDQPGDGFVYAVPDGPHQYQPDDWQDRIAAANAVAFKATADRAETLANLAAALPDAGPVSPELAAAFAGLGFGYVVLDTLCDAMSHDRLLDATAFWADVTAAVEAAFRPEGEAESRSHLKLAAEKLRVARDGMCSAAFRVLDFVFVNADAGSLPPAVVAGRPVCVIASGETLDALAKTRPGDIELLKQVVAAGGDVLCGAYRERDDAVLPIESQLWNLAAARKAAAAVCPGGGDTFARRRSAYYPQLPSWLSQAGFRSAVATTFDGAVAPTRYASAISWSGPDGKTIDAVSKDPLPADDPATFFNLAYHWYQANSHDSNPLLCLKHADKPPAVGYADWLELVALAPVCGEWATPGTLFAAMSGGDYTGPSNADEFFADYLDDRVLNRGRPEPVSGFARHYRLRRRLESAFALAALYRSLTPEAPDEPALLAALADLEREIELRGADVGPAGDDEFSARLADAEAAWAKKLAGRVAARSADEKQGAIVLNPCGFARRVVVELPGTTGPVPVVGPVKASEFEAGVSRAVVEVPGLGFAYVPRGNFPAGPAKPKIVTADGTTVRNEFLEADLDPISGGLRGFRDTRNRINRFGQMLVFQPGSKMKARTVGVTSRGAAMGEVTSEGDVVDEHDVPLAAFTQRIRAYVGRPALELRITLRPVRPPEGYAWHAYYAARFAWRDERAAIFRGVNGATSQSTHARPGSADFVEVRFGSQRTFVFTGGLPFAQKQGGRMLDIVLIPPGETETTFDLLLAADREHPMQTAYGWAAPAPVVPVNTAPPAGGESGWLGHIDIPSLLLTHLRPAAPGEGHARAVTARMIETAGFAGAAELRFARDISACHATDVAGVPTGELAVAAGAVPLEYSAGELVAVKAEWV